IGACIGAGLAAICGIYAAFFKKTEVNIHEGEKKEELDIS
ncbi:5011_t:CDS:1, partial [Racocetra persica]